MSFREDILPILRSMQLVGLFPTGPLTVGGFILDDSGQLKRANVQRKHLFYPLILILLTWFNCFRQFARFVYCPMSQPGDIAYNVMFVIVYLVTAIIRSSFFVSHLKGNRWFKALDHLADGDVDDWATLSPGNQTTAHPLSILLWTDKHTLQAKKHRSRLVVGIHIISWIIVILNTSFNTALAIMRRETFGTIAIPFDVLYPTMGPSYLACVGFTSILLFISDSTLMFCSSLILSLTFELAQKFHQLHKWINDNRKQHVNDLRKRQMVIGGNGDSDQTVAITAESGKMKNSAAFELETLLEAHQFLLSGVHKLDRVARATIAGSMGFGFFGVLVNMYQIAWGSQDILLRVSWAIWMILSGILMFCHMVTSSYLNQKAITVQESLFRLPPSAFAGPNGATNRTASLQLSLLHGQFGTEPIALTFFGIFFLRKETLMELLGAMLTYFLILVDYTAGEKRGVLMGGGGEGGAAKTEGSSVRANTTVEG